MYRPKGFKNPYLVDIDKMQETTRQAYEAGADAMLEGLRQDGVYEPYWIKAPDGKKGYLVFIPDGK